MKFDLLSRLKGVKKIIGQMIVKNFCKTTVVLLMALCCWCGAVLPASAFSPAVFASIFDLNKLLNHMIDDVLDRSQKSSGTNHVERSGAANTNHPDYHIIVVTNHPAIPSPPIVRRALPATFRMPASTEWFDTGISLTNGHTIIIRAEGDIYVGALSDMRLNHETPDGAPIVTTSDPQFSLPFLAEGLVPWSLIGKIGADGRPFEVGSQDAFAVQTTGELYLSVNDNNFSDNSGYWEITIAAENIPAAPMPPTNQVAVPPMVQLDAIKEILLTNSPEMITSTNSPGTNLP